MNSKQSHHSSVGLNSSMLWIMGGGMGTEFVTTEMAVNGPTLPEPVYWHCSVLFPGNGNVYLIGGTTDLGDHSTYNASPLYKAAVPTLGGDTRVTNKVWVANPSKEFTFAQGPSLIDPRYRHMCGTMSIGAQSIIVVAGGLNNKYLATVEILDPLSNKWVEGK